MATIKKGKQTTESKVEQTTAAAGEDPKTMSIEDLFNLVEAKGTRAKGNAVVSAAKVREYADELFNSGKTSVPVAMLVHAINLKHGLSSKDGIQNASVRSAVIAGGVYKIETIDNQAIIVKAPEVQG